MVDVKTCFKCGKPLPPITEKFVVCENCGIPYNEDTDELEAVLEDLANQGLADSEKWCLGKWKELWERRKVGEILTLLREKYVLKAQESTDIPTLINKIEELC